MRAPLPILPLVVVVVACSASPKADPSHGATAESKRASPPGTPSSSITALPDLLMPSMPGSSTSSKPSAEDEAPAGPPPPCGRDEDCWSSTCCPASSAEQCVHHFLAQKCAIVDVSCPKTDVHYACTCEGGACTGRRVPP